jgi:outer membrane protein
LNTFEIDRQSFKLERELELLRLTESRLETEYVNSLIIRPLQAAIDTTQADLDATSEQLRQTRDRFNVGEVTRTDVALAEARVADGFISLDRAELNMAQRQLDLATARRRLDAEKDDLTRRTELNEMIRRIHQYFMPSAGTAVTHSYPGAFVEKGDPICTISIG